MDKDNEFLNSARKIIEDCDERIRELDEEARKALIYDMYRSILLDYIDSHNGQQELCFPKTVILEEENNYDIRQYMDNDIINEVANKGYTYYPDLSNSDILVFKKCDNLSQYSEL